MVHVFYVRTFQERLFARRVLYFFDIVSKFNLFGSICPKSLYWVCQRTWWYDWYPDMAMGLGGLLYKPTDYDPLSLSHLSDWPNFHRYHNFCQTYSPREFTYESDVDVAFTGAATLLAKSFLGGILYGLPILFFDIALLWSCDAGWSTRRWCATHDENKRPPSWSWMSWQGQLLGERWEHAFGAIAYDRKPSTLIITPLVQWYFTGVGGAQIAIASDYHKYKHFAQDSKSTPPPGWSRAETSSDSYGTDGENIYVTPNAPDMKFCFPIPLVDPSCSKITIPTPTSNRITCQTERAYFHLVKPKSQYTWERHSLVLDAGGSSSGVLTLSGVRYESYSETGTRIELIAISTGSIAGNDKFCAHYIPEEHRKHGSIWKFYNVFWIEWTNGVAYRVAVGLVDKEAWETADRELINVVLG